MSPRAFAPRSPRLLLAGALLLPGCVAGSSPRTPIQPSSPGRGVERDPGFVDVAAAAGLRFRHEWGDPKRPIDTLETTGAGCCFLDFDGDGRLDVYLVNSGRTDGARPIEADRPRNALYRNLGAGRFADVTQQAGVSGRGFGMGCSAADYDGDGDVDLFVTGYGGNLLYRNRGNGTFEDVAAKAGVRGGSRELSTGAAWADVTGDGRLDLYVTNYLEWDPKYRWCTDSGQRTACSPLVYRPQPNRLWRNDRDGRFTDIAGAAGVANPDGKGMAALFSDLDGDGRLDLFVANDGTGNKLYRQSAPGRFQDVTLTAGVGFDVDGRAQAGMGCDLADLDGSGRFSLVVATFQQEVKTLYRNLGGGLFENVTGAAGLGQRTTDSLAFGAVFLDGDNDGDSDLLLTNGHVQNNIDRIRPGVTYAQRPKLFRNDGQGRFALAEPGDGSALATPQVIRGVCRGDYDDDGDLDVLVNRSGGAAGLWRNEVGHRQSWIAFSLAGKAPNTQAVGARITVEAGGRRQVAEVRTSGGYLSSPDPRVHFGLGSAEKVERASIRWPDGRVQQLGPLAARRRHHCRYGAPPSTSAATGR